MNAFNTGLANVLIKQALVNTLCHSNVTFDVFSPRGLDIINPLSHLHCSKNTTRSKHPSEQVAAD